MHRMQSGGWPYSEDGRDSSKLSYSACSGMSLVFCCCHAASSWMSIILDESTRTELLTSKSICVIGEIVPAKVVQWDRVYPNPIHCQKKSVCTETQIVSSPCKSIAAH